MRDNFLKRRRLPACSLHLTLEGAERRDLVHLRLAFTAIDLEIRQHDRAPAISLEENERVTGHKARRVTQICIMLARGDDQPRRSVALLAHALLLSVNAPSVILSEAKDLPSM